MILREVDLFEYENNYIILYKKEILPFYLLLKYKFPEKFAYRLLRNACIILNI